MNTISKEQKSNLAKLLATENLNVEHRKVKTAHFVPKTRNLVLPIWDNMSNDLYDLLCGHEVGHALWTPADETKLNEAKKKYNIPHSYLNVIEDIRIDKKMKLKYPGLRKSYFNGYKELVAREFFGNIGKDANHMKFIDRLNIFAKSGHMENTINFTSKEKDFIEKSNHLETFDDVIELAKQIFAYSKEENYDKEKDPLYKQAMQAKQDKQDLEDSMEDNVPADGDDSQDPSDEEQTTSGSGDEDDNKEEDNTSGKSDGKGNEDKPENDKKEKQDSMKGILGGHNPDYIPETIDPSKNEALSDQMYEEAIKSLSKLDDTVKDRIYCTLPSVKDENVVVSSKRINEIYKQYYSNQIRIGYLQQKDLTASALRFKQWKNSQSKTVSYMAKEFEMKKAADNYKKTLTSKTGIINMNKIHSYKFNDDIFKKIQVEPGAKNHGMMMFIDWSGSMSTNIDDTIKQTINLAMFCKAVQIPFRVFAFSDIKRGAFFNKDLDEDYGWSSRATKSLDRSPFVHKQGDLFVENVNLVEWLSSDQKTPEYNENMLNLYRFGEYHTDYYGNRRNRYMGDPDYYTTIQMPNCFRLGGTPLDPAIIASFTLVKEFIAKHKIQKMNTIFLTDGAGHSLSNTVFTKEDGSLDCDYPHGDINLVIKDKQTRKNYKYEGWGYSRSSKVLFDMLRAKTGTNIIGFYITSRNNANYYDIANFMPERRNYEEVDKIRKQMRKDKVGTITNFGYDELFIIPRKNLKIEDGEADIKPEMTAAKMKAEFSKTLKTKKISRVLLNKFVERVA